MNPAGLGVYSVLRPRGRAKSHARTQPTSFSLATFYRQTDSHQNIALRRSVQTMNHALASARLYIEPPRPRGISTAHCCSFSQLETKPSTKHAAESIPLDQRRPRGTQSVAVPCSSFPPPVECPPLRSQSCIVFRRSLPSPTCSGNQTVDR